MTTLEIVEHAGIGGGGPGAGGEQLPAKDDLGILGLQGIINEVGLEPFSYYLADCPEIITELLECRTLDAVTWTGFPIRRTCDTMSIVSVFVTSIRRGGKADRAPGKSGSGVIGCCFVTIRFT